MNTTAAKTVELKTMADVRAAAREMDRIYCRKSVGPRLRARYAALESAMNEAEARTVPCPGEAHGNAHIDNCGCCAPWWGKVLP